MTSKFRTERAGIGGREPVYVSYDEHKGGVIRRKGVRKTTRFCVNVGMFKLEKGEE